MMITLFLMTKKGFNVLNSIVENKMEGLVSKVVVGKDKNIDYDYSTEIVQLCKENNIKVEEKSKALEIQSPYSLAVSWRWIIPTNNSQLIVIHDSLLPKYRGFSPLVNMLIKRETRIGVTALFATEEYDKGDVILQSSSEITYPITISEAIEIISKNYVEVVNSILDKLKNNETLQTYPQDETKATYSLWRDDDDYKIDWQVSAVEIQALINAVSSPYAGASTKINGTLVRILDAEIVEDVTIENRDPGKIIFIWDGFPIVVCGQGLLKITSMVDDETKVSMLPLNKFRIRFT